MARWRTSIVLPALLAVAACGAAEPTTQSRAQDNAVARQAFEQALRDRILHGKPDPAADALAKAREGEFGLIAVGQYALTPPGVLCFTPGRAPPRLLAAFREGDVIDEETGAVRQYAAAYNLSIVAQPGYPDADLCRAATRADQQTRWREPLVDRAAGPVAAPPRDLHEAARRGSGADVRRFLKTAEIDAPGPSGMTALSWAVARNNQPAFAALLDAGADPLADSSDQGLGALRWAALLDRQAMFERLLARATPKLQARYWGEKRVIPAQLVSAAFASDNPAIVRAVLNRPHAALRLDSLQKPLPSAAVLNLALAEQPGLADTLLLAALNDSDRLDLLRLALARHADPNQVADYHSPLTLAARAIYPGDPQAVRLLLAAGAKPDLMAHRDRPVWIAARHVGLGFNPEHTRQSREIFDVLVDAGADLNLPDWRGMPSIWALLIPPSARNEQIDASYASPELLALLVSKGLDINAEWKGRRILAHVEQRQGKDSELAKLLRANGAK